MVTTNNQLGFWLRVAKLEQVQQHLASARLEVVLDKATSGLLHVQQPAVLTSGPKCSYSNVSLLPVIG